MEAILTMEFDGPVAILTLNRPAVLNALNADLLTLLEETLDAFTGDPALRAVILTAAASARSLRAPTSANSQRSKTRLPANIKRAPDSA